MSKLIAFMHISLDGFAAGPNGEMDWIKIDQEVFDSVGQRISRTDTAMYGRKTYELMESYWPTAADKPKATKHDIQHAAWYKTVKKLVLSTSTQSGEKADTVVLNKNLAETIQDIKKQDDKEILVFGSPSATHSLMQLNLIDGYWLFVNPLILGKGIPFFKNISDKQKLTLLSTQRFKCGVTELSYYNDTGDTIQ